MPSPRQMLWNWNTVDACFISSSWRVTSSAMFAGSCIGAVLLVVALELLRRAVKEYDALLVRQHRARLAGRAPATAPAAAGQQPKAASSLSSEELVAATVEEPGFRPNVFQQAVRAFLHMLQFAVAYFVMLSVPPSPQPRVVPVLSELTGLYRLAMYYNGYIIICIFIGAFLGAFLFQWEKIGG